ncbi:MAG: hypothetical protein LBK67_04230 [Coriobacteriales bacterium]|jgi:hypothetical protein|nr:hypothetical protein [Coriobacteriales bacterium]
MSAEKSSSYSRHPLYLASDRLKQAFNLLDFRFIDNGEGFEVEHAGVTFPTWQEPSDLFGWQSDPLMTREGQSLLRTRILPAQIKALDVTTPVRLSAFGRVYGRLDSDYPMRNHIEGLIVDEALAFGLIQALWNDYAIALFGLGSSARLTPIDSDSYQILIYSEPDDKEFTLGYTGPASVAVTDALGLDDKGLTAWVFIIDVDDFALQLFSLPSRASLYENDVTLLANFTSSEASSGYTAAYRAADCLRQMGYTETVGNPLYPDGIYRKMNMIQEDWDSNNVGYALDKPIGELTALRTVLTPSLETILGYNAKRGVENVKVFEIGHIYLPLPDELLPKEHFAVSFGAYGEDVTIESFTEDVRTFLKSFGIGTLDNYPSTDTAIAYNLCYLVLENGKYLDSNFGEINDIAVRNFEIGRPAFMAQLELATITMASNQNRDEIFPL